MKNISTYSICIFVVVLVALRPIASAQQLTLNDYKRAVSFMPNNLVNKEIFNLNIQPWWAQDNSGVAYMRMDKAGRHFELFDFSDGKIKPLFDITRLVKVVSDSLKFNLSPANFAFFSGKVINKNTISFMSGNKIWKANLLNYELIKVPTEDPLEKKSPDGKWSVYVKDYNLYLKSLETGISKKLSKDGSRNLQYGTYYAPGLTENDSEPNFHLDVYWSPNSTWIQTYISDYSTAKKSYFLNWTDDSIKTARLLFQYYANPGDTGIIKLIPVFYNVENGEEWKKESSPGIYSNVPYYNWSKNPGIIYENYFQRGRKKFSLNRIDVNQKTEDTLYSESSETYIEQFPYELDEEANRILFLSEKSGWRQMYKVDLKTRQIDRITTGNYFVNDIIDVDQSNGDIFFIASGKEKNHNPYFEHFYKVNSKGDKLVLLTPENLNHAISLSPDRKYFVDNMSSPEQPTTTVLRSTISGEIIKVLANVNKERLAELNYPLAETFTAIAGDSITVLYGLMWKPSNFDPMKKYPVIEHAYTGPSQSFYPKHFAGAVNKGLQSLAELGFIVINIDGRGSPGRSKKFHNYSYRNMGNNLEDHILAIKQLAKKNNWIDIERVGIMGGSAGGYDAVRGLLAYPDFYKVGVANSGNFDHRLAKHSYPEMYMGFPVDSAYYNSSTLTIAKNLRGKLLIACGGLDDNVYPIATFRLIEALIKAGKDFDFLFFPSQGHVFTKYDGYFFKKRWNYFVEHLAGQTPLWEYEIK